MAYRIWSVEHDAWWRPDSAGYTPHIDRAGLYTKAEATKIVKGANQVQFSEIAIPTREAALSGAMEIK